MTREGGSMHPYIAVGRVCRLTADVDGGMLTAVVGGCLVHAAVGAGCTDRTGSRGVRVGVAGVEGVLPVPGHSVLSCVTR
jgi:hypothetical protein